MTNSSVASVIATLAKAAAAMSSVQHLVEHPQAAWVLAELERVAPATYRPLRDELCRQPDWGGRGVRVFDQAVRGAAEACRRQRGEAEARGGLRKIVYHEDRLPDVADAVQQVLSRSGDGLANRPVFAFADGVCVIERRVPKTVHQVRHGQRSAYPELPIVVPLDRHALRERIMRSVRLVRLDDEGRPYPIMPPDPLLGMVLARRGRGLRPLAGIVDTPLLGPDGGLLAGAGYDPGTGLFFAINGPERFAVPSRPTLDDARAAYRFLREGYLSEFEFKEPTDEAAAVAMQCTAIQRPVLDKAPGFAVTAPVQSSGKTALVELNCRCAYGRPTPAAAWPGDDAEMGKMLLAVLREGQRAVNFDNIADGGTLDSAELAKVITEESYTRRLLGENVSPEVPTNVLFLFTGNNVTLGRDFATRLIEVRIEPRTGRPDARRFGRDLAAWAAEHRHEVVRAALTVMLAHRLATTEEQRRERRRMRFGQWDDTVRQAILWAAGDDEAHDVARKTDEAVDAVAGTDDRSGLLRALWDLFGPETFEAGQVASAVAEASGFDEEAAEGRAARALQGFGTPYPPTAQGVGFVLRRTVNGSVLEVEGQGGRILRSTLDKHRKVWVYRFEAA